MDARSAPAGRPRYQHAAGGRRALRAAGDFDSSVGVLGIRPAERHQFRDPAPRRLLGALAGHGALEVQKEWQLLSEVAGIALLRMEEQFAARPVTTEFPEALPLVPVDEVLLEQVFVNLLENAAKYTPPEIQIELRAEARGREVVVTVADRGPGVPAGEEERIFEKFQRAASTTGKGVGEAGRTTAWSRRRPPERAWHRPPAGIPT